MGVHKIQGSVSPAHSPPHFLLDSISSFASFLKSVATDVGSFLVWEGQWLTLHKYSLPLPCLCGDTLTLELGLKEDERSLVHGKVSISETCVDSSALSGPSGTDVKRSCFLCCSNITIH